MAYGLNASSCNPLISYGRECNVQAWAFKPYLISLLPVYYFLDFLDVLMMILSNVSVLVDFPPEEALT